MSPPWVNSQECYEHVCLAAYEKDILELNLQGTNLFVSLKRWWHDLFLLSYSDKRARSFYGSSHAVRMDRSKQFRLYRKSIHPISKFRSVWEPFIIYAIILNMIIFYHSASTIYGTLDWSYYFVGVILEIIILVDIYINSRTGYINYETRKIVLNTDKILVHYASTKLFAHTLSSLPLQALMFVRYGKNINCATCKTNKFVATLVILNVLRLYRLFDVSSYWDHQRETFKATYFFKFLRICVFGLATMMILMSLWDAITFLAIINTGHVNEKSYFATIVGVKHGTSSSFSDFMFISIEIARACKSFVLFSFSLKPRVYFLDKIASLVSYLVAMIFYMWSLVECYACIDLIHFPQEQTETTLEDTLNSIKWRQLPDSFAMKIIKYYNFNMTRMKVTETENDLYKNLPKCLKTEIILSSYTRLVTKVSYFSDWPSFLIDEIVLLLKEETYLKGDVVAEATVSSDGLMIVDVGVLAVYSLRNEEKGHLIDGDYFGELSLVTDREVRMSTVVALNPCKILLLEKYSFRKLLRDYPQLFFEMKQTLTSNYYASQNRSDKKL